MYSDEVATQAYNSTSVDQLTPEKVAVVTDACALLCACALVALRTVYFFLADRLYMCVRWTCTMSSTCLVSLARRIEFLLLRTASLPSILMTSQRKRMAPVTT